MSYKELILAEPTLLHYWPLDNDWVCSKTGHILTRGGSGPAFGAARQGAASGQFNGTDDYVGSSATLDMTAQNALTIEMWVKFLVYDLAAAEILLEFHTNANLITDGFYIATNGAAAGDPLDLLIRGNVGNSQALYNVADTGLSDGAWRHLVAILDKSRAVNEVGLYLDSVLKTPSSRPFNANNTNSFGNRTLYVASRAGTSAFMNVMIDELAIYSGALAEANILAHYRYSDGRRRRMLCA